MRLLVDTHIALWADADPDRLGPVRSVLDGADVLVSIVSAWEIAIKAARGRLELPDPPVRYWPQVLEALDGTVQEITVAHALGVFDLPHHHGDPFDRLLIAQARALGVPIVTADRAFTDYDVEVIRP